MSTFAVVVDTSTLERRLTKLEEAQLPFARSLAANQAAFATMNTLRGAMPLLIQQPTRFTIAAVRYRKGTKQNPAAEVYLSGDGAKGTPPAKYLTIIHGGKRGQRRSERVLTRAGVIGPNEGWVPAVGLKLNASGNPSPAKLTQILSSIKAFGEEGFSANATAKSRARGQLKGRTEFFVARGGDHLPRGVYERYGVGRRRIRPVLLFVPLPTYGKTFDFVSLAINEARRRFVAAWPAALRRALATAR